MRRGSAAAEAGSDSGPGTARARMQDWGCEWARIKSFTDSASGIAELLCAEVSAKPSPSKRRGVALWRTAQMPPPVAAPATALRRGGSRRATRVIGLLLAATLGAVANWPYALASLRSSMAAVAVAAMPSPSLPAAPSPPPAPPAPPPAPSEPQYVVLGMAGCEAVRVADQVVLPFLRGAGGDASDEVAAGLCRLGTADWRARCLDVGDAATAPVRAGVRFVLSPHLGVRKKMQRPRLIAVLRPPLERLVAEFNARPLRDWRLAASDYSRAGAARNASGWVEPLDHFRAAYAARLRGRNALSCVLAGIRLTDCTWVPPKLAAAAAGDGAAVAAVADGIPAWEPQPPETLARWAAAARRQLEAASAVVLLERFEEGKRALCDELRRAALRPPPAALCATLDRQVRVVGGGGDGGGASHFLSLSDLDAPLRGRMAEAEAADLELYAFAQQLVERRLGPRANATTTNGTKRRTVRAPTCASASALCPAPALAPARRRWADDFAARLPKLQALAPPRKNHPLLFTHIPKCAGSSFRNSLLLEYVRTRRAASKFACVFYRDLSFHENKSSSLTTAGPDCLGADGRIGSRYLVVTGHISYHPQLLARMRAPFTALTFVREPLSRLVSLFNMYPAGTFGKPPPGANTSARAFAAAYRRRLRGRTALTCFVSGATWCDSIGGPAPGALGASALRAARYHLVHSYAVFGLTERLDESFALIAYTFGWLDFYKEELGGEKADRLVPGGHHRRLEMEQLCAVPGLVAEMARHEDVDVALYEFARGVYAQRLRAVPEEVLRMVGGGGGGGARGAEGPGGCGGAAVEVPDEEEEGGGGDAAGDALSADGE